MNNKKKLKPLTEKKAASREVQSPESGARSALIWGIAGTFAALGLLVYFVVIDPGRRQVRFPVAPTCNVLLITLDTTRADHLGCYGYPPAKTPHLDGLAREGIRFARVYCPAPLTLPSHCSIMSGLYPVTHGVRNNGHDLPPGIKTLAEGKPATARTTDLEKLRSLGYLNFAPAKPGSAFPDPKEKIDLLRLIQQAQAYELEERYTEAERVYRRILEDIPDSPAGYVNLAIAQARQNKFDQAIETLGRGIARIPDSEILLVRLGHTYLVTGKSQEALETMEKVLALNPQNVDALTVYAGILDTTGRKVEARSYYERALAVEPESRHLRMSYAGNLASSGNLREAIKIYETLIADFPEEQAFYQYTGIACSYLGEFDRAISLLQQAVAIRPTPVGYFNLAVAYEKSGNLQQAAKYFRLYLENSRGESEVNVRKAKAELENLEKKLGHSPF